MVTSAIKEQLYFALGFAKSIEACRKEQIFFDNRADIIENITSTIDEIDNDSN